MHGAALETYDMQQIKRIYRNDLDLLKGFAILAVVLYHSGIFPSGYLGVDAFLVINGFLIVPKLIRDIQKGSFSFLTFLEKRIMRLLPLMLLASAVVLLIGYFTMLPDDFENLSESAVATNFFSNNILQAMTTKNYWAVNNDYKPLMHTWYIGILFQFYLLLPLILMLLKKASSMLHFRFDKAAHIVIGLLCLLSLIWFLKPSTSIGNRFYLIQYRFFEMGLGGLMGVWYMRANSWKIFNNGIISGLCFVLLLLVINFGIFSFGEAEIDYNIVSGMNRIDSSVIPRQALLLITVALTCFFVAANNEKSLVVKALEKTGIFNLMGKMSYSIFIWHQPVLAFYRYCVTDQLTPGFMCVFALAVFAVSYLTYLYVEKIKTGVPAKIMVGLAFLAVNGTAYAIYNKAGVVRDVPELYVEKGKTKRGMFAEYNDRIFNHNKDFPSPNGKSNVLVIGNSFARDWANILLETAYADSINLSYVFQISPKYTERIKNADYIFFFGWKHDVPDYLWANQKEGSSVWGIGTKNFGSCNGIIYKNRNHDDYFQQRVKINPSFYQIDDMLKAEWGDHYIEMLDLVSDADSTVTVFSKDNKYLSQDCKHLSKGGAEFYADAIDFSTFFH